MPEYVYLLGDGIASRHDRYMGWSEWIKFFVDEPENETFSEALEYLEEGNIPHHFEFVSGATYNSPDYERVTTALHVYDRNVAFQLRLRFDLLPLPQGWREAFVAGEAVDDLNKALTFAFG